MDGREQLGLLVQQAEQLVRHHRGREISLRDPMVVATRERSLVVRCAVTGWDGVASVVLKRNEGDDERGFTDWASLAFLSTLEEATGVAPHLYAGDVRARFFVMEDLGGSRSLEHLLDNADAATVVEALGSLATSMARLVVATSGREESFERMRATLPGGAGLGRRREAARWLEARKRVTRWAAALDIALPHCFDYAGYRHALYDITAWDTLCPLPKEWMAALEQVFRRAVGASPSGDPFIDDEQYRQAWATMCAYRALAMLTWFSPDLLAQDGPWTPGWTRRAALVSTTLRLHQASAGVAVLEPLAELGGHMSEALRARWPELGDGALRWPGVVGAP